MNIQNLPAKDTTIRRLFIPKLDVLMVFDYNQIELRILAWLLDFHGFDVMANAFREGKDLHYLAAAKIFRTTSPTKDQRELGKLGNYACGYGAGPKKISEIFGVSYDEAKRIRNDLYSLWPGIDELIRTKPDNPGYLVKTLRERGCLYTLFGRKLTPEYEYKALNAWIQGTAADVIKRAICDVHMYLSTNGFNSHIFAAVHDELDIDADRTEVEVLARKVPELMKPTVLNNDVPIEVDVEICTENWSEKTDLSTYLLSLKDTQKVRLI